MQKYFLPLFIARHLSLSSGRQKSSPAVRVATAAVALSVAVMLLSISIVIGFKREITHRVIGFNSHISISAAPDYSVNSDSSPEFDPTINMSEQLNKILLDNDFVMDASLGISVPAVFKTASDFKGIYLKSLSGNNVRNFVAEALEEGSLPDYDLTHPNASNDSDSSYVLVSRSVADELNLKVGDKLPTYFIADQLRARPLYVKGIYNSHFDDYDCNFAFSSLETLQQSAGLLPHQGTSIAITVDDFDNVALYSQIISSQLAEGLQDGRLYKPLRVVNALSSGGTYFHWLGMLDTNVWVILILMTVVACVTLVSGMLIIMVDKIRFIALMKALGSSRKLLGRVFLLLTIRVVMTGMIIGDCLGITLVLLQNHFRFVPLDPDSYYMDFVPAAVNWPAFLTLNLGVTVIAYVMLLLPSRFVGNISPAKILARE